MTVGRTIVYIFPFLLCLFIDDQNDLVREYICIVFMIVFVFLRGFFHVEELVNRLHSHNQR